MAWPKRWGGKVVWEFLELLGSVFAICAVFVVLEQVFPAEPGQPWQRLAFNMIYTPFVLLAVMAIGLILSPLLRQVNDQAGGGLFADLARRESWLGIAAFTLVYAFVWDLFQYALHRIQHWIPAVWETHRFHHDETAVNALTQSRHHPASHVLGLTFYLPVVAMFGLQSLHFAAAFVMFRVWGFCNHANLRLELGRLSILLSAPQWHRIHHSSLPEHANRNFATFFPVIDWLFGTYYSPKPGEFPPTGVTGSQIPSLRAGTVEPLLAWYRMARAGS